LNRHLQMEQNSGFVLKHDKKYLFFENNK